MSTTRRLLCLLASFLYTTFLLSAVNDGRTITTRYDYRDCLQGQRVAGGVQDERELIWFSTWNGLVCYDGYDFHQVKIEPGDSASISTNHLLDIHLSDDNNIICNTSDDIYKFDLSDFKFKDITSRQKDSLKNIVGHGWSGLTDHQGNRWHADRNGLFKTSAMHHPAALLEATNRQEPRDMMIDDDGFLWVCLKNNRSINIYNPDGTLYKTITLKGQPYTILQTSEGDIWIGGRPGFLMKSDGESICDSPVFDIAEDSHGRLWVATFGDGIKMIANPRSQRPVISESLGGKRVRRIIITPSDRIIATSTDGLLIGTIDKSNPAKTVIHAIRRESGRESSLASNSLMGIARDSKGKIYISTESSGVDVIDENALFGPSPEFIHLDYTDSSHTNNISKSMALFGDTLLIVSGINTLTAYNTETQRSVSFGRIFWTDSCVFSEADPIRLSDGSWLVGAIDGVLKATPHNIYSRGYVPPIVFTNLSVNGSPERFSLPNSKSVSLRPSERNLSISFAAIDYIDNSGINYRTKLDDSPWTGLSQSRSVTLFGLSPGTHTLCVQSTDRYGRLVDNVTSLTIDVRPEWYETWTARILFILFALAIIGAIIYTILYIRRVNAHRRELLEKYMELLNKGRQSGDTADRSLQRKFDESSFLKRVRAYIEQNIDNPDANIDDMAAAAAASRSTLNRHLRSTLGISASQLLTEARMQHASELFDKAGDSADPAEIARQCGYTDVYYFMRVYKKHR